MAVTTVKPQLKLPPKATYDDYLARPPVPNIEAVVPLNFSSGFSGSAADEAARSASAQAQNGSAHGEDLKGMDSVGWGSPPPLESEASGPYSAKSPTQSASGSALVAAEHDAAGSARSSLPLASSSGTHREVLGPSDEAGGVLRTRVKGTGRKMKARLWLAKGLPINQRQLLPLLDIISTQNQYIGKVRPFSS